MMENTQKTRSGIMRLYNVFYVCKMCLPAIKRVSVMGLSNDPNVYLIKNWGECKKTLDALKGIECFSGKISAIYGLLDWQVGRGEIRLPAGDKGAFCSHMKELECAVEIMVKLCDDMEMGKADSGIDVKIPKCDSLKEYMGYLKEIDFIFSQCPYLLHEKEQVKFNNVDVGSQWLTFVVIGVSGAFYILNNLARLVQKAVAIKSNILVYKQQEEALKEMQLKNEVLDETIEAFVKDFKQGILNQSVSELESEIGELQNGEERDKVKKTLEDMAVLIDKGVEIYSSIETPKEIKVLFPFQEDTVVLPDNILKLIEDKQGEDQ